MQSERTLYMSVVFFKL